MYIERVPNRNSPPAVLLCESYREGDKVRKRTLGNLSKLPDDVIENLQIVLKGEVAVENYGEAFQIIRSLPHGHVAAVLGTLNKLGIAELIGELNRKRTTDVVSPAKRSEKALSKARKKKTEDNLPVHSFSTLMADLGTITLNTIHSKFNGNLISFEKITQPTTLQQTALDLLGVSLLCTQ